MSSVLSDTSHLEAALRYAELGYRVFPCAPLSKKPFRNSNGLKDATTDEARIEAWWTASPTANIAISTEGLVVIDVDGKKNPWLSDEPDLAIDLAIAPLSLTPGGRHYIFRMPAGQNTRNSTGKIAFGVDVRANGGYIIVGPSVVKGVEYSWLEGNELDCSPEKLPELPSWVLGLIKRGKEQQTARADRPQPANIIADGQRNSALTSLAGVMRRAGMSQAEIAAALQTANATRCKPPLDDSEVDTIAASVSRYPADAATVGAIEGMPAVDFPVEAELETNSDPGPTPEHLFDVPGFIGNFKDFILSASPYPSKPLAFASALVTQSVLAARKVRDIDDNRTGIYVVALANSGSGKGHPRKYAKRLLEDCGMADCIIDSLASSEGLEDFLIANPAALLLLDEFDGMMNAIKVGKELRFENIMTALLKLFSTGDETYTTRVKAGQGTRTRIPQPSLSMHASAVPNRFFDSLAQRTLINGFFPRLIILECGARGAARTPTSTTIPQSLLDIGSYWRTFDPAPAGDITPRPKVIETTREAATVFAKLVETTDAKWEEARNRDNEPAMAILCRCAEQGRRLALNYACSADHENPVIDLAAALWASEFIQHQCQLMLYRASASVSQNPFDERCQRMLDVLRRWKAQHGDDWMPFWQLSRRLTGWTPRDYEDVRKVLLGQGRIEHSTSGAGGRPGESYRLR